MVAALLAVSPLHVYYSREARPYALLVLLTTAVLLAILARARVLACGLLVLLLYTSLAAASAIAAIVCAALVVSFLDKHAHRMWAISVAALVALALLSALYRGAASEPPGSPFPGFTFAFFDGIVRGLAVTALEGRAAGHTAYAMLILAIIGTIVFLRRNRADAAAVIALTLLPIAVSVAALRIDDHFFAMRYVISALPAYLVLAGLGIAAVARVVTARFSDAAPVVALAIAVAIGAQTWPAARTEAFQKLDWRRVASTIVRYAKPGDLVLCSEPWSGIVLDYYLAREPKKVEDITMTIQPLAERLTMEFPATWLVSAGFSSDVAVRTWMCRYPLVLGSAFEIFRMHYTSRAGGDFLRERAGPAEWRALDAALGAEGLALRMNGRESFLLGQGWDGPEGSGDDTFRWTLGERATMSVPRWGKRDRVLRLRMHPIDHPSLPRQTVRVELNGSTLAELTLSSGTEEHSVGAPSAIWKDGLNTLTFTFGRAVAPADVDPANGDTRPLAVAFDQISIVDANATAAKPVGITSLRLADVLIDERTAWRRRPETRFPPQRLRRDAVEALLGRLGFDPQTAWPRIQRGELRLEDLAETIAYGSDCESDRDFVLRTYGLLFERAPTEIEERSLLSMLRNGTSRARLVAHIVKSDELRARVLR